MGSEKYKLKWSKYESNILAVFSALLESETLSDVSLFCEGKLYYNPQIKLVSLKSNFYSYRLKLYFIIFRSNLQSTSTSSCSM